MLLEIVRSTIKQVEIWINDMNGGSVKPMESYLSGTFIIRGSFCYKFGDFFG